MSYQFNGFGSARRLQCRRWCAAGRLRDDSTDRACPGMRCRPNRRTASPYSAPASALEKTRFTVLGMPHPHRAAIEAALVARERVSIINGPSLRSHRLTSRPCARNAGAAIRAITERLQTMVGRCSIATAVSPRDLRRVPTPPTPKRRSPRRAFILAKLNCGDRPAWRFEENTRYRKCTETCERPFERDRGHEA
jgi:hypothetical protein